MNGLSVSVSSDWTDGTLVDVGGKKHLKVGTPAEWVSSLRAGYPVNAEITKVKGRPPMVSLRMLIPELGRYLAALRSEVANHKTTDREMVQFVQYHAAFFASRRTSDDQ